MSNDWSWSNYVGQPGASQEEMYKQLEAEFACDHPETRLTVKTSINGARTFRIQCRRCGDKVRVVKAHEIDDEQKYFAADFDDSIHQRWHADRSARYVEIRDQFQAAANQIRSARYASYLASPQWSAIRQAVLMRDNHTCQGCLIRPATQVHHKTYERIGCEMLFDLISVCDECHGEIHRR